MALGQTGQQRSREMIQLGPAILGRQDLVPNIQPLGNPLHNVIEASGTSGIRQRRLRAPPQLLHQLLRELVRRTVAWISNARGNQNRSQRLWRLDRKRALNILSAKTHRLPR
jgi:hypothetical protein